MKERNVALTVLFSIVTCGVYSLYWIAVTTGEIESTLKNRDGSARSGGMTIFLVIVTCGVYLCYWWFKSGKWAAQLGAENDVPVVDNGAVYLAIAIVGQWIGLGTLINTALLQSSLNTVTRARLGRAGRI